ncbi:MAG: phenylacetate--CoA ligase [Spirochaetia bacterium]|nr:phenylacetate--CoA ligase [Spirochaetia bacterium]
MIYNPQAEQADQHTREAQQLKNLKNLLKKVYSKVPFYKEKFDKAGVKPEDLKTLSDLKYFPFTTKSDLRDTYPLGLAAVPKEEIVEIHCSSGTTGIPVVDAYTRKDLDTWSECMARTYCAAGATSADVLQNAYGYGLFTGGVGAHYGGNKLGMTVIPISSGNTERQINVMRDFGSSVLTCTPSYALYIAEVLKKMNVDRDSLKLRIGCLGAEPWSDNMRREIEEKLKIKAYDIYGLTEITGPGVASECECQSGLHINEDFFYPEIINSETGEVLPYGERGELVFTTLTKEGTPLIRYRTRDITYLYREKCSCGRTTVKMHRLFGRVDDMLIIKGVNVFPAQIEQLLMQIKGLTPNYQIILTRGENHLDDMEIQVEVDEDIFSDETRKLETLKNYIFNSVKSKIGIYAKIKLVEPRSISRSEGKAKRVIDKRVI